MYRTKRKQYKPITSLSGPFDPIPVHRLAQEGSGLDYECELVAVIGKQCADVPESKALDYVLGYAVGNDVSHRDWQIKRGGGQWALGKGFDGWAPFGPGIVSSNVIKDPQALKITTRLNGKTMQVCWLLLSLIGGWDADALTGELYGGHDIQREEDDCLLEPGYNSSARRHHLYRDVSILCVGFQTRRCLADSLANQPRRRWNGQKPAGVAQGRRRRRCLS